MISQYVNYVVYDPIGGEIIRSGSCSRSDFHLQSYEPHTEVLEGVGNDINDKIENGLVRRRSASEINIRRMSMVPIR